jgi:hypothetical protein
MARLPKHQPKNPRLGHGAIPIKYRWLSTELYGGPYREKPVNPLPDGPASSWKPIVRGIKMAAEITAPYAVNCPTADYGTPDVAVFKRALLDGFRLLADGELVYVGCMGGIGRTGLYMAGMAKLLGQPRYVRFVRRHYKPHAVETAGQQKFLKKLDLTAERKQLTGILVRASLKRVWSRFKSYLAGGNPFVPSAPRQPAE